MQHRSFTRQTVSSSPNQLSSTSATKAALAPKAAPVADELARMFNTALVATRARNKRDYSSELFELAESSSFKAILNAVRQLASVQGITERQATEQVINTFRKMDELWGEYIFHEGIDRLRGQR